jgi:hypothetical protein
LSLDEAYLDVTENLKAISSATQIAEEIRARIRDETELSFGRRLLQQVHGMMPDILFVRFGSRRSPKSSLGPSAAHSYKGWASPSLRCFPSDPPQGWQ